MIPLSSCNGCALGLNGCCLTSKGWCPPSNPWNGVGELEICSPSLVMAPSILWNVSSCWCIIAPGVLGLVFSASGFTLFTFDLSLKLLVIVGSELSTTGSGLNSNLLGFNLLFLHRVIDQRFLWLCLFLDGDLDVL